MQFDHQRDHEIIKKAAEALRQRLGEDALRYLAKRLLLRLRAAALTFTTGALDFFLWRRCS